MAASSSSGGPSWGLVVVRVAIGWILAQAGWSKVTGGYDVQLVEGTAERIAQAPELYAWFGQNVVLRYPEVFAALIAWGELLGGIALLLGAFVRPVGLLVAFQMANFYFAGPESAQLFVLLIGVCALACSLSRAGRAAGLDHLFDRHFPRWITWSSA